MYQFVYSPNATSGFKSLVDFTTTFSFLVAPIIAIVNFKLMQKKYVGQDATPPVWMKILSYLGIAFLIAFSVLKIQQELMG